MKNDEINYMAIFDSLDTFTGLPIRTKYGKWYGACRIDGTPHKRRDKLCCYLSKSGNIRIIEQGEQSISLWDWLIKYGGCSSNSDVIDKLIGNSSVFIERKTDIKIQRAYHVDQSDVDITIGENSDTLFYYLSSIFSSPKVNEAYRRYNVGSRGLETVFWYKSYSGEYCFDKGMSYLPNGHRDRNIKPTRTFLTKDGFTDRCFFGEHLLESWKSEHYVVESEKTALIGYLYYNKTFIATGGSSCIDMIGSGSILLPDFDAAGDSWKKFGKITEWWKNFKHIDISKGDDIGDAIIKKIQTNKRSTFNKNKSFDLKEL